MNRLEITYRPKRKMLKYLRIAVAKGNLQVEELGVMTTWNELGYYLWLQGLILLGLELA